MSANLWSKHQGGQSMWLDSPQWLVHLKSTRMSLHPPNPRQTTVSHMFKRTFLDFNLQVWDKAMHFSSFLLLTTLYSHPRHEIWTLTTLINASVQDIKACFSNICVCTLHSSLTTSKALTVTSIYGQGKIHRTYYGQWHSKSKRSIQHIQIIFRN